MAIITKYYRLFEVRILHEYFLIAENDLTYFDQVESDRTARLEERLSQRQYGLMNDIWIEPDKATEKRLKDFRLKFIQTATGMTVASGSRVKTLADGTEVLAPEIDLDPKLELNFLIKLRKAGFRNYTSLPMASDRVGGFLFTNAAGNINGGNFKTMSRPIPAFLPGTNYLPGDLANHVGILREAFAKTNNNSHWENIESQGYVNENDRRLFQKVFSYFPKSAAVNGPAKFTLSYLESGDEIKSINFDQVPASGVRVNFRNSAVAGSSANVPIPDGRYQLRIETVDGVEDLEVFLSDALGSGDFGMVNIRAGEIDPDFRVVDENGGLILPHPKFEIRLRSRKTFWRYRARENGRKIQTANGAFNFFHDENNNNASDVVPAQLLVTRLPQKLANLPIRVRANAVAAEVFPQPGTSPLRVKKDTDLIIGEPPGRIFSDIHISTVKDKIAIV